jgi:hypothetical protein
MCLPGRKDIFFPHFLTTELLDNLILIPVVPSYFPNLHQTQIELEIYRKGKRM